MKEQLTEENINKLFTFVKSKYVHYIDVQHEIVDHLASAIEEKQKEDFSLSFDRALNQVYSKFPITGFVLMVEEKSKALNKFWLKKFLGYMLSYMKLPKIIIAGFLIYLFHLILHFGFIISPEQLYYILVSLTLLSAGYRYKYGFEFSKEFRDNYLVTGTYLSLYSGIWFIYFFIPLYTSIGSSSIIEFGYWQSITLSVYLSTIILLLHAYTFVFPKMLKNELQNKYGHLKIKLT